MAILKQYWYEQYSNELLYKGCEQSVGVHTCPYINLPKDEKEQELSHCRSKELMTIIEIMSCTLCNLFCMKCTSE